MSEWADATDALQKLTRAASFGGAQLSYQQAKKYAETVRRLARALNDGPAKRRASHDSASKSSSSESSTAKQGKP